MPGETAGSPQQDGMCWNVLLWSPPRDLEPRKEPLSAFFVVPSHLRKATLSPSVCAERP